MNYTFLLAIFCIGCLFQSDYTSTWAKGVVWWGGEDTTPQQNDWDDEMMSSLPSASDDHNDVTQLEGQLPSVSLNVVQFETKPNI